MTAEITIISTGSTSTVITLLASQCRISIQYMHKHQLFYFTVFYQMQTKGIKQGNVKNKNKNNNPKQ